MLGVFEIVAANCGREVGDESVKIFMGWNAILGLIGNRPDIRQLRSRAVQISSPA